ncbi:MAG: TerC family protein [Myxococcota bacterium]
MFEWLSSPEAWVSLAVLTLMEIVLGIDNIVFISILSGRLPKAQQLLGRRLGLAGALVTRLLLLGTLSFLTHLETVLFTFVRPWTARDLVLLGGGLFLIWKATREIYDNVEHPDSHGPSTSDKAVTLASVMAQVMLLDVVFSLDSVITAVGMADHLEVMALAIVIAVIVMLIFAGPIGDFVDANPSIRVLALAFLVLIGVTLVMEGTGSHVEKGYIYSAMGFSLLVQILNLRRDRRAERADEAAT